MADDLQCVRGFDMGVLALREREGKMEKRGRGREREREKAISAARWIYIVMRKWTSYFSTMRATLSSKDGISRDILYAMVSHK